MRVCPICGTTSPLTNRRCPECGARLDGADADAGAPPRSAPSGDIPRMSIEGGGFRTREPHLKEVLPEGAVLNGRYRVARVLGTGAFGRVYLAEEMDDPNHLLAVKELLVSDFSSTDEQRDATNWFKREVSALLTLDHPGIPAIHGYWTAHRVSGPMYLAMDYIPGKTLADVQEEYEGRVPRQQVVAWGIGRCDVLAYLHGRTPPFVFRDIKPANVIVHASSGRPVLIYFGLARQIVAVGGTAVGTWGYVPFEQVLGKAEARSDLYALGAMMYSLLSGRQPDVEYRRALRNGLDLERALRSLFPPLESLVPGIAPALSQVIVTATQFDARDRFASAEDMADALRHALATPGGIVALGPTEFVRRSVDDAVTAAVRMQIVEQDEEADQLHGSQDLRRRLPLAPADLSSLPSIEHIVEPAQPAPRPSSSGIAPSGITPSKAAAQPGSQPSPPSEGRWRFWRSGRAREAKPQPRSNSTVATIVVSPGGDGHVASISEAIRRAPEGARIEVHAGHYVECLRIDRPVEIVGVGGVDEVVIESSTTSCILMQADAAIIRGVTIRAYAPASGDRYYGVNIPVGRLLLEDCQVFSDSLACVAIHGKETNPILRHCLLQNSIERALAVYDHAHALVEECEIVGSTMPVRVSSHANPMFRHCLIHGGGFGGVGIADQGRGRFEECDIVENGHHGVSVRYSSYAVLIRCRINRNGWNAISVADNSGATVEHCDLTGNQRPTWDVKDTARPQVETRGNIEG